MDDIFIDTYIVTSPHNEHILSELSTANTEIVIRLVPRSDGRFKSIDSREEERFYTTLQYGIMNNVPMSELADRCCLSLSTFKRRFKDRFRCSPHEWIVTKRMEVAHDILCKADITISSLAKLCCYNNTSHFIEVFKNHYGTTPYTLRKSIAEQRRSGDSEAVL